MLKQLLGGMAPQRFLSEYWQKKPLLVRQAFPGFTGLLTRDELLECALDEDNESRLVWRNGAEWHLKRGPLAHSDLRRRGPWSVLLQGVNLLLDSGDELLHTFNLVPWARLDDLMVSYATDGGGVGPHFDPYDVFLLQGMGRRRWQISTQHDQTLLEGAPLRILKNWQPSVEWVLEPGDLLYLPPQCAHNGIAEGECMTYSIGFHSPYARDLGSQFLFHLQDRLEIDGIYQDPDLKLQKHPGKIAEPMLDQVEAILKRIRWNRDDVREFLGRFLSEPKVHVYFDPPRRPLSRARFAERLERTGLKLHRKSQLLFSGDLFFMNGEQIWASRKGRPLLRELADQRSTAPGIPPDEQTVEQLYEWYSSGYVVCPSPSRRK